MTQAKITITRTRRGLGFPDTQRYVKRAAAAALKAEGVTVPCELDVTLTDDAVIHTINREQRGVDRATDVLSFPMNELTPGAFDPDATWSSPWSAAPNRPRPTATASRTRSAI